MTTGAARDDLIVAHIPLVHRLAGKIKPRLPPQVEMEELVSYGYTGLVKAADNFDPGNGTPFDRFASSSIRGAIIDGLRKLDWAPRSLRRRARLVETARSTLRTELGREPSDIEVANEAVLTVEEIAAIDAEVSGAKRSSLDESDDPDGMARYEYITDEAPGGMAEDAYLGDLRRALLEVIATFEVREQLLLVLHYFEEMTLADVGKLLGIPESRASQIHTRLVMLLRQHMQEKMQE